MPMMATRIAVMTVSAFTLCSTLYSGPEALTVIFSAGGFLACAPSGRYKRWHAFEVAGISVVCYLLGVEDACLVAWVILAARADAVCVAGSAFGEALTVELQAVYLGALAAWMISFHLHFLQGQSIGRVSPCLSFLQEFLKEIFDSLCSFAIIDHPQSRITISSSCPFLPLFSKHLFPYNYESRA